MVLRGALQAVPHIVRSRSCTERELCSPPTGRAAATRRIECRRGAIAPVAIVGVDGILATQRPAQRAEDSHADCSVMLRRRSEQDSYRLSYRASARMKSAICVINNLTRAWQFRSARIEKMEGAGTRSRDPVPAISLN